MSQCSCNKGGSTIRNLELQMGPEQNTIPRLPVAASGLISVSVVLKRLSQDTQLGPVRLQLHGRPWRDRSRKETDASSSGRRFSGGGGFPPLPSGSFSGAYRVDAKSRLLRAQAV